MKFKGTLVTGDFQENTITIEMEKPIVLKAGDYVVIPIEEFKQQIIDACNQKEFEDIDGMGIHETITKGEQYYEQKFQKK